MHRLLLTLFVLLGMGLPLHMARADAAAARAFTQGIFDQASAALDTAGDGEAAREAAVTGILQGIFDVPTLTVFLLGSQKDALNAEQLAEFQRLLPQFLAASFASQFDKAFATNPTIQGTRAVRGDTLVEAQIPRANDTPVSFGWRVRTADGQPRVVDIVAEGTSFMLLRREEFTSRLRREGPESLLSFMRDKAGS